MTYAAPARPESLPSADGRRKAPRAHLEAEVDFYDETTFYNGFSENISAGGIFIATYKPIPMGTRLSLSLTLPGDLKVEVTGTVRWIRELRNPGESDVSPGVGVQFEGLSEEAERHIEAFVAERAPMFFDE